jgi:hypothetical protein
MEWKGLNAQKNVKRCKDFCACASSIQKGGFERVFAKKGDSSESPLRRIMKKD